MQCGCAPVVMNDAFGRKSFALGDVSVMLQQVFGPMFGCNGILSVKPTVFAGGDRPGKWGVEVGFKVLGFRVKG